MSEAGFGEAIDFHLSGFILHTHARYKFNTALVHSVKHMRWRLKKWWHQRSREQQLSSELATHLQPIYYYSTVLLFLLVQWIEMKWEAHILAVKLSSSITTFSIS